FYHCYNYYLYLVLSLTACLPLSTLFPYTTLFRSSTYFGWLGLNMFVVEQLRSDGPVSGKADDDTVNGGFTGGFGVPLERSMCELDRKSTRLNSSHVSISYAVFCLQKKNALQRTRT